MIYILIEKDEYMLHLLTVVQEIVPLEIIHLRKILVMVEAQSTILQMGQVYLKHLIKCLRY